MTLGARQLWVRQSLVRPEQLTKESSYCVLIDGSMRCFPTAIVPVVTEYFSGEVKAMCVESPIHDVIIGNIPGATMGAGSDFSLAQPQAVSGADGCRSAGRDPQGNKQVSVVEAVVTRSALKKESEGPRKLSTPVFVGREISREEFKQMQKQDESLTRHFQLVQKGTQKAGGDVEFEFFEEQGILYRHVRGYPGSPPQGVKRVLVPKELRTEVVKLAHESIMSGHLGSKKTLERILTSFYWPGIGAEVKRFCLSCDICQRTVPKGRVTKVPLEQMPLIDTPFSRVSIDLTGPLIPATDKGNRYILVVVDHATRYPEAIPLKSIDTETVAEAMLEVFSRVGFPQEVLSDRGTQFTSDLMREVSRLVSIRQIFTTPYNPKCNGLVERMNGTLKSMLRKMCAERPRDWDRFIPAALFAYREVPNGSTGFSPFELLYGRTVRGPMQVLKELWTQPETSEVCNTYQYVLDLREKLEETCQLAREKPFFVT